MNPNYKSILAGVVSILLSAGVAANAIGQEMGSLAKQIVGTWDYVSVTTERADGTKFDPWAGMLKGRLILTSDGQFAQHNSSTATPKLTAGRLAANAEESTAAYRGSYALMGTYTVNEVAKTMTWRIYISSFPNEIGAEQTRTFLLKGNELSYVNAAPPSGGRGAVNVLKRAM